MIDENIECNGPDWNLVETKWRWSILEKSNLSGKSKFQYLMSAEIQTRHRGGRLALIMKENIKVNLIESRMMKTFELVQCGI